MPYTKTTWVNDSAPYINATNLNKIETGIETAQSTAEAALTSVSQSDVTQHQAALSITESQISDLGSYLTAVPAEYLTQTEGDARYLQSFTVPAEYLTQTEGDARYLQSYTVTQSDVTAHQAALTITESQISDLGSYLTSVPSEYLTQTEGDARYLQSFTVGVNSIGVTELNVTDGTSGQVLTTDGAGNLSFSTVSAGGSNFYLDGATFNTTDGVLTLSVNGTTNQTVDLDGRYALTGDVFSGNYNDLTNKPTIPTVPTTVSSFTNDSGYITDYTVTQGDVTAHQAALSINDTQVDNTVYNLTGTALSYSNGSIQRKTLSGAVTLTDSLNAGEVILLTLVNNGTHAVTFPTITWITSDSTAPTAAGDDSYVIWKEGTTLYGAYVGYA